MTDASSPCISFAEPLSKQIKDASQPPPLPPTDLWQVAIERILPAVVSLRVNAARTFDTDNAGCSFSTGFVVDEKLGIILTNRHVVTVGPVSAEAYFVNREQTPVTALYRDPIHDFGFFRFNPKSLKFLDIVCIPLHPDGARVGLEVRVVGNDAGIVAPIFHLIAQASAYQSQQEHSEGWTERRQFIAPTATTTTTRFITR